LDSPLTFQHDTIIFDSCSLISLYATGVIGEILRALPSRSVVCNFVKEREALYMMDHTDTEGTACEEAIDLQPIIDEGLLHVCSHELPQVTSHVIVMGHTGIRGMGEKISGSLALVNNWAIATDDLVATSKLRPIMPNNQIVSSLELIRYWSETHNIASNILRQSLQLMQFRARYSPKKHPLYPWMMQQMTEG